MKTSTLPLNPSATKPLFANFLPPNVLTFVSDRACDFTLLPDQVKLNPTQEQFLSQKLGIIPALVNIRQVHDNRSVVLKKFTEKVEEADGIITNLINQPIAVRTADCLPVFIYAAKENIIGVVHAGWKGTYKKITAQALKLMIENYQVDLKDIKIAFGPAIQSCCYEVGNEFKEFFPQGIIQRNKTQYLDVAAVNKSQILELGVLEKNIFDCAVCTFCDTKYFSFRREKDKAGRMISLMMMKG